MSKNSDIFGSPTLAGALSRHLPRGGSVRLVGPVPSDAAQELSGFVLVEKDAAATVLIQPWTGSEAEICSVLSALSADLADAALLLVAVTADHRRMVLMLQAYGFAILEQGRQVLVTAKIPQTLRLNRRAGKRPLDPLWSEPAYAAYVRHPPADLAATIRGWKRLLSLPPKPPTAPKTADLLIYGIDPGGAERQICMLAVALHDKGWRVRLLTVYPPQDRASHYLDLFEGRAIAVSSLPHPREAGEAIMAWAQDQAMAESLGILRQLPPQLMHAILGTWRQLEAERPELLVSFLDSDNLRCALAGLLAGAPHIILCGRSVHPGHFPAHYCNVSEVTASIYRLVLTHSRVQMLCNSRAGAESYADWLGIAPSRIGSLPNSVSPASRHDRGKVRQSLGIADGARVVTGVFRLSPEKRPELFLAVVARLVRTFPDLIAIMVGDGILRQETEWTVARLGLGGHLRLLGIRQDVDQVLAASDLLLHVSRMEGLPNVVLEAQLQHCPVVVTTGGGAAEAVMPPLQFGLCHDDDPDQIARICEDMLQDPMESRRLAAEAGEIIARTYTPARSVEALLAAMRPPYHGDGVE